MKVIYEHNSVCSPEEVSDVFKASGIRRPIDDLDRLTRMISNANKLIIGIIRRSLRHHITQHQRIFVRSCSLMQERYTTEPN